MSHAQAPATYFSDASGWQSTSKVVVVSDSDSLEVVSAESPENTLLVSVEPDAEPLVTKESFGDSVLSFEILFSEDARAGLYLQGRYEIVLRPSKATDQALTVDSMGALAPRWDESRDPKAYAGVIPMSRAGKSAGEWQTVSARFRAPRYNEAGQKVESALLLEVRINGELVQRNTIATGFTQGAINAWETTSGPLMLRLHGGSVAIRDLQLAHADFENIALPTESGGDTNEESLQDFVDLGEKRFKSLGCTSCHAINQGEASVRAGPNLYGLFQREPRDRVVKQGESDTRFTLKADRSYLHSSVRMPDSELAIGEQGAKKGQVFQPIMPAYSKDTLSDSELDAIGAYLKTLNPLQNQGPVVHLVEEGGPVAYDPLTDGLQKLVLDNVEIQRGPMPDTSGRAVHVGLPNGVNYSFDPRVLGVVKLWQGGFLDMSGELTNRGGAGLNMGYNSREIDFGDAKVLFAPLLPSGEVVDFSFKEAVFQDFETIRASLYSEQDHLEKLAAIDARFEGYTLNSQKARSVPAFHFRVGSNQLQVATDIGTDGTLTMTVDGELDAPQSFQLATDVLNALRVSVGKVEDGIWTLPKATTMPATLTAQLELSENPWRPPETDFGYETQPLKVVPSEAALLNGYTIEDYLPPKDNYGRDLLFEALGIAVAEDGTIVVATRNAGIWRIVDGQWQLFAEGMFDSLGVVIEDKKGLDLVVGQKAELTRVRDTNGDGRADRFETLFDGFGYHSNYHTYLHGPVKGKDGAYYFGLNLAHTDEAVYKADGLYMGSQGGFSGWAFRVTTDGEATPWASGLRSAAGWTRGPDGEIWITENQGEFVGTSKLFVLKKDAFYGHPSSLVDMPGMTPDSPEIEWENVWEERAQERLLMPQNLLANSPGHPVWDLTEGQFGPFAGQMLIGDQTQSNLFRVALETLPDGTIQGAAMPFARDLASGAMRPVFLPDGSLLLGQTGRGWQAKGGHVASLQRIVWTGERAPLAIERMVATDSGFEVHFTRPLPSMVSETSLQEALSLSSWTYRDAPDYGSERLAVRDEAVSEMTLDEARQVLYVTLSTTEVPKVHPQQTARVYHLVMDSEVLQRDHATVPMSAFYTLHRFPSEASQ
ncbi:family 16 glycoside hydrolase [Marinimicrobium agarilyticum]|uniref:family 16 glycoside hydrolase n=1 Tax=Marinimicrobium agarilyticum TaxID=306546 RepID=UPI000412E809|nr:family 16 glycoside hydrolase [Marinimicrobium agarilyticum]